MSSAPDHTQSITTDTPRGFIVVGVDGSASSLNALKWAAFQGAALECDLVATTAWRDAAAYAGAMGSGFVALPTDWNPEHAAAAALAGHIDAVFAAEPPPGLRTAVREGGAAEVLLAESRDARLLVLGSRGHGGFAGLLLGSVSSACAEHASCPVLVVHGDTAPPSPRG